MRRARFLTHLTGAVGTAILGAALLACEGATAGGDSVEEPKPNLGELDTNNDGHLTADDLAPGEVGVLATYRPPTGDGQPLVVRKVTEDAFIVFDVGHIMCPPGWGLTARLHDLHSTEDFSVAVWFHDTDIAKLNMTPGESDVAVVSADFPSVEHGGRTDGPFPTALTVSGSNGMKSSGFFDSPVEIEVGFYSSDMPLSGEGVVLHAIAFRNVPTGEGEPPPEDCAEDEPMTDCVAIHEETCFRSAEEACEAACGSEPCIVLESLPAQILCE